MYTSSTQQLKIGGPHSQSHIPTLRVFTINPNAELNHVEPDSHRQFKVQWLKCDSSISLLRAVGCSQQAAQKQEVEFTRETPPEVSVRRGGREGGRGRLWPPGSKVMNSNKQLLLLLID